jgi:hypothetical protein
MDEFEIGQILHLKSEIPKSQIGLVFNPAFRVARDESNLRFRI